LIESGGSGFRIGRRRFGLCDVFAAVLVRDHADLALAQLGVGLDALDQRSAARGRGELLFERDDTRTVAGDRLERFQRLGVCEGQRIAEFALLLERGQIFRSSDNDGIGHVRDISSDWSGRLPV
jgi:hypothetical protein